MTEHIFQGLLFIGLPLGIAWWTQWAADRLLEKRIKLRADLEMEKSWRMRVGDENYSPFLHKEHPELYRKDKNGKWRMVVMGEKIE